MAAMTSLTMSLVRRMGRWQCCRIPYKMCTVGWGGFNYLKFNFSSYSVSGVGSRLQQIIDWFGEDFDGLIGELHG